MMNGRGHGHPFHSKDSEVSPLFATEGLVLATNPAMQLLGGSMAESLGDNIIPNGDFHDYTMDQFEGGDPIDETADAYTLTEGSVDDGALSDTTALNGNTFDIRETQSATPGMDIDFDFGITTNYIGLYFHLTGSHNSSHDLTIQAHNGTSWDDIGIWEARTDLADAAFGLEPEHTISGNVSIRILHPNAGITAHVMSIDHMYVNAHYPQYTKAHWIFDDTYHETEQTGLEINEDLSANGRHLISVGMSTDFEDELVSGSPIYKDGNGLQFDGVDDRLYLDNTDTNAIDPLSDDFSVAISFKEPTQGNDTRSLMGCGDGTPGWDIKIGYDESLSFVIRDDSANQVTASSSAGIIPANTFCHVVGTVDRTANMMYLYLNGVQVASADISTVTDQISSGRFFTIGRRPYVDGGYLAGSVYEVMIHIGKVMTASEVGMAYNLSKGATFAVGTYATNLAPRYSADIFAQPISRNGGYTKFPATLENDQLYKLTFKILYTNNGSATNRLYNVPTGYIAHPTDADTYSVYFNEATKTGNYIEFLPLTSNNYFYLEYIKVQKVLNASQIDNGRADHYLEDYSNGGQEWTEVEISNVGYTENIVDTDTDGVGDGWQGTSNATVKTYSLVTGNGFTYNAQRSETDASGSYHYLNCPIFSDTGAGFYRVRYKYRSSRTMYLDNFGYADSNQPANTGDAIEVDEVHYHTGLARLRFQSSTGGTAAYLEIGEIYLEYLGNGYEGLIKNSLETNDLEHPFSLNLDGVDDFVDFGKEDIFEPDANIDFILGVWVHWDDTKDWATYYNNKMIFGNRDAHGSGTGYEIAYGSTSGQIQVRVRGTTNEDIDYGTITAGWNYICLVRDNGNTLLRCFVNGVEQGSGTALTATGDTTNDDSLNLGANGNENAWIIGKIGMAQMYHFDGNDGRPSALPSGFVADIIQYNYDQQKQYYEDL